MYSREHVYSLKVTLNNLLLLKIAHDHGLDMSRFSSYQADIEMGDDPNWQLFTTALDQLFEVWDVYDPFDCDKEDKTYWLNLVKYDYQHAFESLGIIVMLHDDIQPFERDSVGSLYLNQYDNWYGGFGEFFSIDRGIVLVFDEDDGLIDYTETLAFILSVLKKTKQEQERTEHEMAV